MKTVAFWHNLGYVQGLFHSFSGVATQVGSVAWHQPGSGGSMERSAKVANLPTKSDASRVVPKKFCAA